METKQITEIKPLRPLRAIRTHCVECSGGSTKEVRECSITRCPLFPYRMGRRPGTGKDSKEPEAPEAA